MNPKKTMADEAIMKELRLEMKRKPCTVCNGKMHVPCKTCKAPKEEKKPEPAKKEEKKKKGTKSVAMFGMDDSDQAESNGGKDEFRASVESRIDNYEPLIKKKEKKDDKSKKNAENTCKTCKGTGETICPNCIKQIREIRDNTKGLMDKEIKAQLSALRKELVERSKESQNAAEDDEE